MERNDASQTELAIVLGVVLATVSGFFALGGNLIVDSRQESVAITFNAGTEH